MVNMFQKVFWTLGGIFAKVLHIKAFVFDLWFIGFDWSIKEQFFLWGCNQLRAISTNSFWNVHYYYYDYYYYFQLMTLRKSCGREDLYLHDLAEVELLAFQIFIVGNKTLVLKTTKFWVYSYYNGRFYDTQGYCKDHP